MASSEAQETPSSASLDAISLNHEAQVSESPYNAALEAATKALFCLTVTSNDLTDPNNDLYIGALIANSNNSTLEAISRASLETFAGFIWAKLNSNIAEERNTASTEVINGADSMDVQENVSNEAGQVARRADFISDEAQENTDVLRAWIKSEWEEYVMAADDITIREEGEESDAASIHSEGSTIPSDVFERFLRPGWRERTTQAIENDAELGEEIHSENAAETPGEEEHSDSEDIIDRVGPQPQSTREVYRLDYRVEPMLITMCDKLRQAADEQRQAGDGQCCEIDELCQKLDALISVTRRIDDLVLKSRL